ncbi:hypothetical protein DSO57_1015092 [Entomophthora muscae]|uniref:Uncharacterized protein n=1 Tax=Entomophthora muscae TaxID=34485 RepID=A0ACC2U305_9FUNG|nr:hypothetical protein DSO57_1015092 [Entomophthora muscae]
MSIKESRTDVLIVGAGPVGLSLAIMLAQMKHLFACIYDLNLGRKRFFRQLGVLEAITQKGRTANIGFGAFYQGEHLYDVSLPLSNSSCPYYVGLEQSETELILTARLKELGVEIEKGIVLESFVFKKDQQVAESALVSSVEDKEKERISFIYVVGCDGGHSLTRNLAGISFSGENVNIGLTLCDVVVKTNLKKIPSGKFNDLRA